MKAGEAGKKRRYIIQIIILLVFLLIVIIVYTTINQYVNKRKKQEFTQSEDQKLLYHIDSIEFDQENQLMISGWAFYMGVDANQQELTIILRNIYDDTDVYFAKETKHDREDINDYYLCEYNYTNCGFNAVFKDTENTLSKGCYEILIKSSFVKKTNKGKNKLNISVSTYRYSTNGELTACREDSYDPIEKTGTFLDEVVERGEQLFYRRNEGIYLYKYEGFLYWIANDSFIFEENGKTYIPYQPTTTQNDRLPESRQEKNLQWDNIGFYFEKNEYTEEEIIHYRMTSLKIPTEYSIAFFNTGVYKNGNWVWRQYVH